MTTAVAVIVDVSLVAAVALLVCGALRHRPAALRHMVLAASLAAVAAVPLFETTLPHLELPVLAASQLTSAGPVLDSGLTAVAAAEEVESQAGPRLTSGAVLAAVWTAGFVVVFGGLLTGLIRLIWMTSRCRPVLSGAWRERAEALSAQHRLTRPVLVLESPDRALLLTWGVFRPRIIVPAGAGSWMTERIDVVLAHELAHIVRRDWAWQVAAETLRAIHWFNPLVWVTCRRLRDESELACDDAVLRRGLDPVDYASHLLAVARHVLADGRAWASAPAVAEPSTLERRIAAMMNESRNRQPLTRAVAACVLSGMLAVTVPIAAATLTERLDSTIVAPVAVNHDVTLLPPVLEPPPVVVAAPPARRAPRATAAAAAAPQEPASVSGTLRDASGAMLPGVQVTLTSTVSDIRSSTVSDGTGAFAFRGVPASTYALVAQLPGFSTLKTELMLASGQSLQTSLMLQVGSLMESVSVTCASAAATVSSQRPSVFAFDRRVAAPRLFGTPRWSPAITLSLAAQQVPVRIGGQIQAPRRIKEVSPICPGALPAGAGGIVILESTIGADGQVSDIKVLRPLAAEFVQAATEAIRQWQFTPTRLNNVPVPVTMTVTVTFAAK